LQECLAAAFTHTIQARAAAARAFALQQTACMAVRPQ